MIFTSLNFMEQTKLGISARITLFLSQPYCASVQVSTLITPVGYVKIYRLVDKPKSKCAGPKTKHQIPKREMGFRTLGLKSVGFLWQIEVHQYGVGREGNFSCFADQKIHTGCLTLESVTKP